MDSIEAADELLKRYYLCADFEISQDIVNEALSTMLDHRTSIRQKKAARVLLKYSIGNQKANEILEGKAIIKDRVDPLVIRWTKKVKDRDDKKCRHCGSTYNLEAHHISPWSNDIFKRINVDNGITLCKKCHALVHPELSNLIIGRGGNCE